MTARLALLIVLCVVGGPLPARTQTTAPDAATTAGRGRPAAANPDLERLLQWLDGARVHVPGTGDPPATAVGRWPPAAFDQLLDDLGRLSAFLTQARENRPDRPRVVRMHGRWFTREQVEAVFEGNETLARGAVMHADIAVFVIDALGEGHTDVADSGHVTVEDGRGRGGVQHGNLHWRMGRRLLDAVTPHPGADAFVRLWYRAVAAHLLRRAHLAEAGAHLERARQIFPDDPFVLLDSAYLHECFSSPALQAAAQELRDGGANVGVDSRGDELEHAARFFRQALAVAPDDAGARLRLGHTLGDLGRHEEAAAELRTAMGGLLDEPGRYLAELFLGREEQALERPAEARQRYENAAALYPRAQSPWLALSQLARQSGDRAAALEALGQVTGLPASGALRHDPWWGYYEFHAQDAGALMSRMRGLPAPERR